MSRVFESIIMYYYCFCLLFRSKERRIRPSNQDDVFPFEEEILGIKTICGETHTRTPNTKRIYRFFALHHARVRHNGTRGTRGTQGVPGYA